MKISDLKVGEKYDKGEFTLGKAFPITQLSKGNSVQNFSVNDETGDWIRAAHFRVSEKSDLTKYDKGTPLTLTSIVVGSRPNTKDPSQTYPVISSCVVKIGKDQDTKKETAVTKPDTKTPQTQTPAIKDDNIARQSSIKAAVELATSDAFKEGRINLNDILTIAELIRGWVFCEPHPEIEERAKLILEIENLLAKKNFEMDVKSDMLFCGSITFLRDMIKEIEKGTKDA